MDSEEKSYAWAAFPAHAQRVDEIYRATPRLGKPWLPMEGAAARLGVSIEEFASIVKDGRIVYLSFGKRMEKFRFNPTDLDTFAASEFLRKPSPRLREDAGRLIAVAGGVEMPYARFLRVQRDRLDPEWRQHGAVPVGWIYFLEAAAHARIKIGHTENHPTGRRRGIQAMSPTELDTIGIIRGTADVEHMLHRCFAALRWQYEWFNDHRRLRAFIKAFAVPASEADNIEDTAMHPDDAEALHRETVRVIKRWVKRHRPIQTAV